MQLECLTKKISQYENIVRFVDYTIAVRWLKWFLADIDIDDYAKTVPACNGGKIRSMMILTNTKFIIGEETH